MAKKVININKMGQVTIFIILAMLIAVLIGIFFTVTRAPKPIEVNEENPQAFIESCTREAVEEALGILMPQGGYLEPLNYKLHQNEKVAYLCYTGEYYKLCSNQNPMLIEHIEQEIKDYVEPRVSNCFQTIESELEGRYDIEVGEMTLSTELRTKQVIVDIEREFKMTRGDDTRSFNRFRTVIITPVYDLAKLALQISSEESVQCIFDYVNYAMLHPENDIRKFVTGDKTTIYTLKEKKSGQEFKFAVRSCALPPGF